jgi:multisubunit Na+/H+ antiporter MnhE subunit
MMQYSSGTNESTWLMWLGGTGFYWLTCLLLIVGYGFSVAALAKMHRLLVNYRTTLLPRDFASVVRQQQLVWRCLGLCFLVELISVSYQALGMYIYYNQQGATHFKF